MKKTRLILILFVLIMFSLMACDLFGGASDTINNETTTKTTLSTVELTDKEWADAFNLSNYKNVKLFDCSSIVSEKQFYIYADDGIYYTGTGNKYTKLESGEIYNCKYDSSTKDYIEEWNLADESTCYVTPTSILLEKIFNSPNDGTQNLSTLKSFFQAEVFGNTVTYTAMNAEYQLRFTNKQLTYIAHLDTVNNVSTIYKLSDYGKVTISICEHLFLYTRSTDDTNEEWRIATCYKCRLQKKQHLHSRASVTDEGCSICGHKHEYTTIWDCNNNYHWTRQVCYCGLWLLGYLFLPSY